MHCTNLLTLIIITLTSHGRAAQFLPPWTAGRDKDYSQNLDYAIGTVVQFSWSASFSNASITFLQDNRPGDAQGGPSANLESTSNSPSFDAPLRGLISRQVATRGRHIRGQCHTRAWTQASITPITSLSRKPMAVIVSRHTISSSAMPRALRRPVRRRSVRRRPVRRRRLGKAQRGAQPCPKHP